MSDWQPGDVVRDGVATWLRLDNGAWVTPKGRLTVVANLVNAPVPELLVRDGQPVLPPGAVVPRVLAADEPEPPRPWVIVSATSFRVSAYSGQEPWGNTKQIVGDRPVYVLHAPDGAT